MRGVVLTWRFRFGQDGAHCGEQDACCDQPVFAAGWKDVFKYSERGLHTSRALVVQEIRGTRNTLVAKGVVQKDVCTVVPV